MSDEARLHARLADARDAADLVDALGALTLAGAAVAVPDALLLLRSPHDEVRAAAAHYLGFVATGLALPELAPIVEADPVEVVRTAARHATERILGERDRGTPTPWAPSDEPTPIADLLENRKAAVARERVPERPSRSGPERSAPPRPPSRSGPARAPVGTPPARTPPPPRPPPPTKAARAVRILGRDDADRRDKALALLRDAPPEEVDAALTARPASGEEALGQVRAIRALQRRDLLGVVRSALSAPDEDVRRAAVDALAALADAEHLPALSALLRDGASSVRVAAIRAVVAVARRTGQEGMARTWLTPLRYGADRVAAEAAEAGIAELTA